MYFLHLIMAMVVAYLAGSINFAILISRWAKGIDIREVGNRNPGTSNVRREVGMGWAALVFLGDLLKGIVPLFLAKHYFFYEDEYPHVFSLFLVGMAAIAGHCWPLYHQFKGGGGLATSIGIYMFFIPVLFLFSLTISFLTVQLFLRKKKYSVGQLVPMIFVPLTPLILVLSSLFLDFPLTSTVSAGREPWYLVVGIAILSAYLLIININIVKRRFSNHETPG